MRALPNAGLSVEILKLDRDGDLTSMDTEGAFRVQRSRRKRSSHPRRRRTYNESQRTILDAWMVSHESEPYLSSSGRRDLAARVGLSEKQVAMYASNYRRRRMPRLDHELHEMEGLDVFPNDLRYPSKTHGQSRGVSFLSTIPPSSTTTKSISNLASLEAQPPSPPNLGMLDLLDASHENDDTTVVSQSRTGKLGDWQGSLLDWYMDSLATNDNTYKTHFEEMASDENAKHTLAQYALCENDQKMNLEENTGSADCPPHYYHPHHCPPGYYPRVDSPDLITVDSMRPLEGGSQFEEDLQGFQILTPDEAGPIYPAPSEAGSHGRLSDASFGSHRSYASLGSRSGRRAYGAMTGIGDKFGPESPSQTFSCDHCLSIFSSKYSRDRHVSSIHKTDQQWACQPVLPAPRCPLCRRHVRLCEHRMPECWMRPISQRTFYRKDTFVQHLRGFHNASEMMEDSTVLQFADTPCIEIGASWNRYSSRVFFYSEHL
jgi:Homeodomain